jgi:hypothetical protein
VGEKEEDVGRAEAGRTEGADPPLPRPDSHNEHEVEDVWMPEVGFKIAGSEKEIM